MHTSLVGNTDIKVSALGLGCVKFGRNTEVKYPQPFAIPTDKEVTILLKTAQNLGINLLDTAPAYGDSEQRLGKLLQAYNRENWVISTKVGESFNGQQATYCYTEEHIIASLKNSLYKLQTDYIDIVLVHSNGKDIDIIKKYDPLTVLRELKQQGLIRAYGMSSKTVDGGILALQNSDLAMVTLNEQHTTELPVIAEAVKLNKGIFIKKGLISGHSTDIDKSINMIFNVQGITSLIVGTINLEHLKYNCNCVNAYFANLNRQI